MVDRVLDSEKEYIRLLENRIEELRRDYSEPAVEAHVVQLRAEVKMWRGRYWDLCSRIRELVEDDEF